MHSSDRDRWNERYRGAPETEGAPAAVLDVLHRLPTSGRALDVAGGAGGAACELAARGLDTTLVDVSDRALELANRHADQREVTIAALRLDLAHEPFPPGPWDVICCIHYLQRSLFPAMVEALSPGGFLVVAIATRANLERHERPSACFLLDGGELPTLVEGLEIVRYVEGWNEAGRHDAELLARKRTSVAGEHI